MPRFDWSPINETVKIGDQVYTRQALESMPPTVLDQVLHGLPVYTSKWMPDTMIVMGNRGGKTLAQQGWEYAQRISEEQRMANQRPYSKLTGSELSRVLADQLSGTSRAPIEATAFGETNRTYLVDSSTSPYLTTTTELWSKPIFDSKTNVETVFRVGSDGRPEAVTRLVDHPMPSSVRNAGESDMAWLKRRVDEICWRPA